MNKSHCDGCVDNFYNGNNPFGIQRCWLLDDAKLVKRRRVGINEMPPHTREPEKIPACYRQRGYVFLEVGK